MAEGKRCCHRFGSYLGLSCCADIDADNPAPFLVPSKDRFCTDIVWLLGLLFMIASQGFLIEYAQNQGADTRWLFHGVDINGTVCDENYPSDPPRAYAMWPHLFYYHLIICTADCNNTLTDARMAIPYRSELALNAWCLPADQAERETFDQRWDGIGESFNRAAGDIVISQFMFMAAIFIALIFCFAYMGYIGHCGGVVVWLTIILSILGGAFMGYALITKSAEVIAMGWKFTGNVMKYTGWTLSVITGLFALGIIFMRGRIALAIKVIKEAARAMESVPTIILFPFLCTVLAMLYFAYWCVGALYIYSVAEYVEYDVPNSYPDYLADTLGQQTYIVDEFDKDMRNFLLYHIFGLFWVFQFIVYFCYAVMAHVFSEWYFAKEDGESGKKMRGNEMNEFHAHPICHSIWIILRYHLGTVAFGAFIVAVVKFINAVLTYLQAKAAKKKNPLATAIFACAKCLLKCLECCLDILSKNGLVFTAVYGTPFCHSCAAAFKMLFNNLARVAAVTAISKYLEFLGKIAITILTAGICIFVMEQYEYYAQNVSSLFFPALIIIFIAYGVASIFMVVFEVAIDTIFLCFLIDEQCHMNGSKYATDGIKRVIDEHQKESLEAAHHVKTKTMAHRHTDEELTEMHKRGVTYEEDALSARRNKKNKDGLFHSKPRNLKPKYVQEARSSARGHYGDDLDDV